MQKGFTLVELLVVIAIITILVAILVPVVTIAIGDTQKTGCMRNLKIIGRAFAKYRHDHEDRPFPTHMPSPATDFGNPDDVSDKTGLNMDDELDQIGDCGMNAVWPMIDAGMLPQDGFRCPADKYWKGRAEAGEGTKYGWSSTRQFSYGIHNPYSGKTEPRQSLACPNIEDRDYTNEWLYKANSVVMADFNPTAELSGKLNQWKQHSNHTEHGKGGISTVTWVGNVSFHKYPNSHAGLGDDIYIDQDAEEEWEDYDGVPDAKADTVITPRLDKEQRNAR